MGHDDDCVFKINQKLLQPSDRVQIQMVCRLVEQQYIRIAKKRLRQQNFYFLAAVQIFHQRVMYLCVNAKTV